MCKLNAAANCVWNFKSLRLFQGKKYKFTFFCGRELGPILYIDKNKKEKKTTTVKTLRGGFKLKHKQCNNTGHFAKYHNIFKVPTIWEYYGIFWSGHWWSLQSDWLSAVWFIHESHYSCSKSHLSQIALVMFCIVSFLLYIASFLFQI